MMPLTRGMTGAGGGEETSSNASNDCSMGREEQGMITITQEEYRKLIMGNSGLGGKSDKKFNASHYYPKYNVRQFSGQDPEYSVQDFILQIRQKFAACDMPQELFLERFIPSFLSGHALVWFVNEHVGTDLEEFINSLIDKFANKTIQEQITDKIYLEKMDEGELPSAFIARLIKLNIQLTTPIEEGNLTQIAFRGLHPSIKVLICTVNYRSTTTLMADADRVAYLIQEEQRSRYHQNNNREVRQPTTWGKDHSTRPPTENQGLRYELYYVRDGVVNNYAMQFSVVVQANINELHFVWQNLLPQPLPYSIDFTVNNPEALGTPQLNITQRGVVPDKASVFRISLPCSGLLTAEVEVFIQMNFSTSASNITVLNFKRRKVCLKGGWPPDDIPPKNDSVIIDPSAYTMSTKIFYITLGCACGVIFIVVLSVGCYYLKSNKARRSDSTHDHRSTAGLCNQAHTFLRVETPNNASSSGSKSGSYSSFRRFVPGQVMNGLRSSELADHLAEISVQREKIKLKDLLQEGTFGKIYHGVLVEDEETGSGQNVFVKTVTDQASQIQINLLIAEGMMMFGLNQRCIQPVLAVALEDRKQPYLLYPFAAHGNLKRFLQKCKFSPEGHAHVILTQELVDMAIQIAQGMQYLHKRKIIHRDLSTRNCVIDERLQVRITDNALARDLFPNDYHCLGDNENRPIKWMALECLVSKQFYTASDVWSFGVTLWELMTLGQQPYIEIDPFEMVAFLKDGYRLSQPINCPDELFTLMGYCWVVNPDDRPTFSLLHTCLQDFYTALGRYI